MIRITTSFLQSRNIRLTHSEIVGSLGDYKIFDQNISHYLRRNMRQYNYEPAIFSGHIQKGWTHGEFRKNVSSVARSLLSVGVRPSERILSFSSSSYESRLVQAACSLLGCIYVSVPPEKFSSENMRSYLNQFQPQILYLSDLYKMKKDGKEILASMYDTLHSVIPELALSYPGQRVQLQQSQEFPYLKKCILSGLDGNEISKESKIKPFPSSMYSIHEDPLCRFHLLLHPDEPVISLFNPNPPIDDKVFICYSHSHCMNAGGVFAHILGLNKQSRIAYFASESYSPTGAIVAPFAAMGCGSELISISECNQTKDSQTKGFEEVNQHEVECLIASKALLNTLRSNKLAQSIKSIKKVAIFEDSTNTESSAEYLEEIQKLFKSEDVYLFRGPIEACYMVTWKSVKNKNSSVLPCTALKVVGDRGTYDAKILALGMRGNLKLRGPHVTPFYYSNAGFLTEFQDEFGWVSTSRDAIIHHNLQWETMTAQIY